MHTSRLLPLLFIVAACTAARATGVASSAAEEGSFVLRSGTVTLASERFQRSPGALAAELTTPIGVRVAYAARLRPDASVSFIDVREHAPGAPAGDPPMQHSTGTFEGDSALLSLNRGGDTQVARRATTRGVVPYIDPSPSLMEQIVRRARALGGRRADVPVWLPSGGGQNATATVEFTATDSVRLRMGGTEVLLHVDADGRVLGGSIPSQGLTLERQAEASRMRPDPGPRNAPSGPRVRPSGA